jgi:hypothetical protein
MRRIVFAAAAIALMAAVPASAQQVYQSNEPAAGDGSDGAALPGYGTPPRDFGYAIAGQSSREPTANTGPSVYLR